MITELTLADVALSRGGRRLISGLSLSLSAGEACALVGPNGSGKTSLLRAIAGLMTPDAGAVGFGSLDPDEARGRGLHFAAHLDGLKPARTAAEELAFWARWAGGSGDGLDAAVAALDLERLLPLEVRRLSAGQRRRVALARLVATPRPLWLLDEPLSPLDAAWRARFGQIMEQHRQAGGLILAAVHDPLPIAAKTLEIGR